MNSFHTTWNGKRPRGRKPKAPKEKVISYMGKGLTTTQAGELLGLSGSRVRAIWAEEAARRAMPAKTVVNPEIKFGRIIDDESETQKRIRDLCQTLGVDNRCIVRQATEDERREFGL